ncbi:MAG TPA: Ig-like domain-containing protein [Cellulomonas sp.]
MSRTSPLSSLGHPVGALRRWSLRSLVSVLVLLIAGVVGAPAVDAVEPGADGTGAVQPTVTAQDGTAQDGTEPLVEDPAEPVVDDSAQADAAAATADPDGAADPDEPASTDEAAASAEGGAAALTPFDGSVAATGQVSGLTLTVVSDGTANSDGSWDATDDPGEDSSATNGIVRTHDSVVYRWGYSVAEAGDVTLVQTLPVGMSWVVAESTAVCAEGTDAVSGDGRTISCTMADQATGASTYLVRATVEHGTQGQELSTVLSGAGTADSAAATVTVSATPQMSVRINSWANGFTLGGESGEEYGQSAHVWVYVYQDVDDVRGVRGSEGLTDSFSFTLDPSDMGAGAMATTCTASSGTTAIGTSIGGTRTATNSVPKAGSWSCSQDEVGGPITVTVTGAITDLRSYPTTNLSGSAVTGKAYATFGLISLWIPNEDYPAARTMKVQVRDFDPDSASGQSNFGDGYAVGQEPDAAPLSSTNYTTFTFATSTEAALTTSLSRVYAADGGAVNYDSPQAEGTTSTTSGVAPMAAGETLRFGGSINGASPWGDAYSDVGLCMVWDESLLSSAGAPELGYGSTDLELVGVEYAHLDVSTDAERRTVDCGTSGDGATEWSSSVEGAGGTEVVNAVRFTIPELPFKATRYLAVPLTRTEETLDAGTVLPVFWQVRSAISDRVGSTFTPATQTSSTLGSRAISADGKVTVDVSWAGSVTAPGTTQTMTVQPTVTGTAPDASVAVTLPAGTTVLAGSWPAQHTPSVVENADGSATYTFALGDLAEGTEIEPVTFDVTTSARLEMPATLTASAVITSVSDPRVDSYRTASASTTVNATTGFAAQLSTSGIHAISGVPLTYTLTWVNGLDTSQGDGSFVVLLPFEGDARGTTGTAEPVTLDDVQVSADMAVTVQFTTDAAAAVETALTGDRSGGTGITWTDATDGADLSGVTAVRFVTGDIAGHTTGEATLTVTPGSQARTAVLVTDLSGTVDALETPLAGVSTTRVVSGNTELSGEVYLDRDYAWEATGTSEPLAGVQVLLTGHGFGENGADDDGAGDDIVIDDENALVATTDAAGRYVFDGLLPGEWTVQVDESTLPADAQPITAAEAPDADLVLSPAEERTAVSFGYIVPLDQPVLEDLSVQLAPGGSITVPVPDGLDGSVTITGSTEPSLGTVTVAEDGASLIYTASATPGSTSFTWTVTDAARQTATATVSVQVVAPPTASSAERVVGQGSTALDLADLVTGEALVTTVTTGPQHGTVTVHGSVVGYRPTDGYVGDDSFTYTVTDAVGSAASASVRLVVLATPVAADGSVWTTTATPVAIDPVALGTDLDGRTVSVATAPTHGTVEVAADGVLTYTPEDGWTGTDTLAYQVTDAAGQQATATVVVRVVPAVVAEPDTARTAVQTPVELDVLANDTAQEGAVTAVTQPAHGGVVIVDGEAGTVRYTPADGFSGTETFTYTLTDAVGQTATGSVTVTVLARPTAEAVSLRVPVGSTVEQALVATGTELVAALGTDAEHGAVTVTADGTLTYTPDADHVGTDRAVVIWTDPVGQQVTQSVSFVVYDGPVLPDSTYLTGAGVPLELDLLAGASASTTLTVTTVSEPGNGALSTVGAAATYVPADGFAGTDTFTVTATDEDGQSVTATVTVTVDPAPVAPEVTARTASGTPVLLDVLADATGVEVALTSVTQPAAGTATVTDGRVRFVPTDDQAGVATFTYTVTDRTGVTATGTVTVTVVGVPVAQDVTLRVGVDTSVRVDLAARVAGDDLTATVSTAAAHGTFTVDADGVATYRPEAGYLGTDLAVVTWTDPVGQTAAQTVQIAVVSGPVVPDAAYRTGASAPLTIDLLDGASASSTLTVTGISEATGGTLTVDGSTAVYTPADGFSGLDGFTVTAVDEDGLVATGTVTVTVYAVPGAPAVSARTALDSAVTLRPLDADAATTFDLGSPAYASATVTAVTQPEHGSVELAADGTSFTFVPEAGLAGTSTFGYTVTDDLGQSAEGTVEVRVVALTAAEVTLSTTVGSQATVDVLGAVTGENLQIESLTVPLLGTAALLDGQVVYTAAAEVGTDTFAVTVADDLGQRVTVTVQVEVAAAPSAPGADDAAVDGGTTTDGPGAATASDGAASSTTATGTGSTSSVLAITGGEALGMLALALALAAAGTRLVLLRRRRSIG